MSLLDMLARSAAHEPDHGKIYGAVVGVVSNLDDPDSLGRVKVRFPWLKEDDESRWARVVSFMAGPSRGAVFRPEVGDEVLVLFEHGDMRFPYVIGALWNGKDHLPQEHGSDASNDVRLVKTRSGHTLVFDDTSGSEKITITDKGGSVIELSADGVTIKSKAIKIGDGAGESLVLGDAFMQLFNTHTHGTGVGPSSPPTQPMMAGQHISKKHKVE
jgi:uncharacterized protein involved in type VI secretion and phage assembly